MVPEQEVLETRPTSPRPRPDEAPVEETLRPARFDDFIGQARVVDNLKTWIRAAQAGERPLDHILFTGPPGLGKTTLAHLVAKEMRAEIRVSSGPVLERPADLAGILSKLRRGDIFFIDEVHALKKIVAEYLYSAMEDFRIDITIDEGPYARTVRVPLERFTLVAATTRAGRLLKPFRERFGVQERLMPYAADELATILARSARVLGCSLAPEAARTIAIRSRGTPRVANRLLARSRDVALAEKKETVDAAVAERSLRMLGVDTDGLDEIDRRILRVVAEHAGTPVGLKTIAIAVDEEDDTVEEVYEPYLIQQGLLAKTPRGRLLTDRGYKLAGFQVPRPPAQPGLFQDR
ncbi:MAG TPA: Holliday junction branch migration DNA helicase RuvB [Planctomycetota bacterium]|nr:Holliday junction branch migration DNA helicase RuvB [Planctomycetota bacterium]